MSKTDENDRKSTYDNGSIRPICELQVSASGPYNTNEDFQGWLNPYTFVAQKEYQESDEWIPPARQLCEDEY